MYYIQTLLLTMELINRHSALIGNIILSMREFQEKNGIKKQCITNAQYLYDIIKVNSSNDVKVKAVIVVSSDKDTGTLVIVGGHLVVILDDDETVFDPSYETFCLKNKSYFDNIKDVMDAFDDKEMLNAKIDMKETVRQHINFMKYADEINRGECLVTEKKFYNDQADYIEKLYSK